MIKVTTPREALLEAGIDPETAWADDEGLTNIQRAQLRALGRSEVQRKYNEVGQFLNNPTNHGMGADGGQVKTTAPQSDPAGMSDQELQAAIDALQGQQQAPAVQPQVAYWQGGYHTPAQPQGNDATQTRPDYGTVQQRPAYNFTPQQASQPMSVQAAQVQNMNNQAQSTEWKQRLNGLLDMPGFTIPGLLQ